MLRHVPLTSLIVYAYVVLQRVTCFANPQGAAVRRYPLTRSLSVFFACCTLCLISGELLKGWCTSVKMSVFNCACVMGGIDSQGNFVVRSEQELNIFLLIMYKTAHEYRHAHTVESYYLTNMSVDYHMNIHWYLRSAFATILGHRRSHLVGTFLAADKQSDILLSAPALSM